jgi:hypothetical protein
VGDASGDDGAVCGEDARSEQVEASGLVAVDEPGRGDGGDDDVSASVEVELIEVLLEEADLTAEVFGEQAALDALDEGVIVFEDEDLGGALVDDVDEGSGLPADEGDDGL